MMVAPLVLGIGGVVEGIAGAAAATTGAEVSADERLVASQVKIARRVREKLNARAVAKGDAELSALTERLKIGGGRETGEGLRAGGGGGLKAASGGGGDAAGGGLKASGGGGALVKTGGALQRDAYFTHPKLPNTKVSLHVATFGFRGYVEEDLKRRGMSDIFQSVLTPGDFGREEGFSWRSKNAMLDKISSNLIHNDYTQHKFAVFVDDSMANIDEATRVFGSHIRAVHIVNVEDDAAWKVGMSFEEAKQVYESMHSLLAKSDDRVIALIFDADETMYDDHMTGIIHEYADDESLSQEAAISRALAVTRGGLVKGVKEPGLSKGFTGFLKAFRREFQFHPSGI